MTLTSFAPGAQDQAAASSQARPRRHGHAPRNSREEGRKLDHRGLGRGAPPHGQDLRPRGPRIRARPLHGPERRAGRGLLGVRARRQQRAHALPSRRARAQRPDQPVALVRRRPTCLSARSTGSRSSAAPRACSTARTRSAASSISSPGPAAAGPGSRWPHRPIRSAPSPPTSRSPAPGRRPNIRSASSTSGRPASPRPRPPMPGTPKRTATATSASPPASASRRGPRRPCRSRSGPRAPGPSSTISAAPAGTIRTPSRTTGRCFSAGSIAGSPGAAAGNGRSPCPGSERGATNDNPFDASHPVDRDEGLYKSGLVKLDWQNNLFLHPSHTLTAGLELEERVGPVRIHIGKRLRSLRGELPLGPNVGRRGSIFSTTGRPGTGSSSRPASGSTVTAAPGPR